MIFILPLAKTSLGMQEMDSNKCSEGALYIKQHLCVTILKLSSLYQHCLAAIPLLVPRKSSSLFLPAVHNNSFAHLLFSPLLSPPRPSQGSRDNMSVVLVCLPNAPKVSEEAVRKDAELNKYLESRVEGENGWMETNNQCLLYVQT